MITDLLILFLLFLLSGGEFLCVGQIVDGDGQEHIEQSVVAKDDKDDEVETVDHAVTIDAPLGDDAPVHDLIPVLTC